MSETRAVQRRDEPAATLESVMVGGDLAALSSEQRLDWYRTRCEAAGLDPRAQPFQYINLQGKLTLYATKAATDQLAANRGLCVEVLSRQMTEGEIYEVVCRVRDSSGRVTEDLGAVFVGQAKGEALANARLKAVTKAKRRTVLAHCGLGMLDETETEHIPGGRRVQVSEAGEVLGELPERTEPAQDLGYWRRRAMALYTELGGVTSNQQAMREDLATILGIEPTTRAALTLEQWQKCAEHMERQLRQLRQPEREAEDDGDPFGDVALAAVEGAESGSYRGLIT